MKKIIILAFIIYLTADSTGLLCRDCPLPSAGDITPTVTVEIYNRYPNSDIGYSYQCLNSLCSYCGHGLSNIQFRPKLEGKILQNSPGKRVKFTSFAKKLFRPPKDSPGYSPQNRADSIPRAHRE